MNFNAGITNPDDPPIPGASILLRHSPEGVPGKVRTYSGKWVNLLDLKDDDIDTEDIAHHLSNECRWNGACEPFFSVAEHSMWVMFYCREYTGNSSMDNLALLHDGAEYLAKDIPRPLKLLLGKIYTDLTDAIDVKIHNFFNVPLPTSAQKKMLRLADNAAALVESYWFTKGPHCAPKPDRIPSTIFKIPQALVRPRFLSLLHHI